MNASKENCQKARDIVGRIEQKWQEGATSSEVEFVMDFLEAALKKLPSQAAFDREKAKKPTETPVQEAARKGFEGEQS